MQHPLRQVHNSPFLTRAKRGWRRVSAIWPSMAVQMLSTDPWSAPMSTPLRGKKNKSPVSSTQSKLVGISLPGRRDRIGVENGHVIARPRKCPLDDRPDLLKDTASPGGGTPIPSRSNLGKPAVKSGDIKFSDLESGRLRIGKTVLRRQRVGRIFGV